MPWAAIVACSASFHIGAVRIGLTSGECGISYHLPRLIGASRAFELMLTGRPLSAEEADKVGLVSCVVDDEHLLSRALEMAAEVLRNCPYSIKHTKRLMWANLEAGSLDAALELENHVQVPGLLTEDFGEASDAFAEKRPPRFTGRQECCNAQIEYCLDNYVLRSDCKVVERFAAHLGKLDGATRRILLLQPNGSK